MFSAKEVIALCTFLVFAHVTSAAKIACFPFWGGSHYNLMRNVAEELASRGHEVALVLPSSQKIKESDKFEHKIFTVPYNASYLETNVVSVGVKGSLFDMVHTVNDRKEVECSNLLHDKELINSLKDYDLIVGDISSSCSVLIASFLDIKRVDICPGPPTVPLMLHYQSPMPVSYVPNPLFGFSDKMSFFQRMANAALYLIFGFGNEVYFIAPYVNLKSKFKISPGRSFGELISEAELVLVTADFALEYPLPLMPGVKMVGAMNIKKPEPLSPELEQFVEGSGDHGVVIVSFGSIVSSILDRSQVDMLAEAFGKLKQKVLWRLSGYIPPSLGPNIKIMDWLPQNDLLAHPKTRALVSHVGHNSLYEAAYRGVPVVAVPLTGDQPGNARKAEHLGFAVAVQLSTTSAEELFQAIERVIQEPSFKESATRISRLLSDRRRTSAQESADWIEYVLRHGGARHLRPEVFNIPWYQFYLLDVIAFLVAVVTVVVLILRLVCRCVCRVCSRKRENKPKAD